MNHFAGRYIWLRSRRLRLFIGAALTTSGSGVTGGLTAAIGFRPDL